MNSDAISLGPSLRRRVGGRPVPRDQGRSQAIPGDNGDTRATRRLEYEGLSEDVCWGRRVLLARLAKTLNGTFPLGKHHLNTAIYDVQYLEQAISPDSAVNAQKWRGSRYRILHYLSDVASACEDHPSAAMGARYVVREAKTKQELDDIMDVIWAANYTPYEPFMQLFFPVLGYTTAHREAAIAESKERFWKQHEADHTSHWFYAFDTVTSRAVGCAQWVVSTSNPFAPGTPKLTAPWWPEGDYRRFCESILDQVYRPRSSWMTRPHCGEWSKFSFLKHAISGETRD
jgi:hypothetical protein